MLAVLPATLSAGSLVRTVPFSLSPLLSPEAGLGPGRCGDMLPEDNTVCRCRLVVRGEVNFCTVPENKRLLGCFSLIFLPFFHLQ